MIKNDLVSLLKSISPLYYLILTLLVSFISLCASFEASLIYSWGTLTLTNIDHVSIMKFSVFPTLKEVESPDKVIKNMLACMGIEPRQILILVVQVRRLGDIRRPIPGNAEQYHLMRVT